MSEYKKQLLFCAAFWIGAVAIASLFSLPWLLLHDRGTYVLHHKDGRRWVLNGPPRGHPDHSNTGLPGQWTKGYYFWHGPEGEVVKVRKDRCTVTVIPEPAE